MSSSYLKWIVAAGMITSLSACANTVRGVKTDTEKIAEKTASGASTIAEKTAAGAQTLDVKSALVADKRVDASHIDVDTYADTKTVVLRGSVPNVDQKQAAEAIARDHAKGYTVNNQLSVTANP